MPAQWPAATRQDHQQFCENEGWILRHGDHDFYHFTLSNGSVLYTRISHPVDRQHSYGQKIWHQILQQLGVGEEEFWTCVRDGKKPDRGQPEPPREAVPANLIWQLRERLGLTDEEISKLTKAEAVGRMQQHWMAGGEESDLLNTH